MPMRQVAAMGEIHSQNHVVLLERGHIDGHISGSARVSLHVGVLRAEEFLRAIDRQLLDLVGVLATAVVAFSRVTLGVFVGKTPSHPFRPASPNEALLRNTLDAARLP